MPRPALLGVLALGAILALAGLAIAAPGGSPTPASSAARAASSGEATVALGAPTSLDPAVIGDAASAGVVAQLFESLTAFDENLVLRPALARSWDIFDGGQRFVFHLRPGLTFSDGTPLSGPDVVRSWFRLIDPAAPSPLASLLFDVEGASDYVRGGRDRSSVGLTASGDDVEVRLRHPATDFVAILTGPSLAVVPPSVGTDEAALLPGRLVSSGGYRLLAATPDELTLEANDRYWAGPPAIRTVHLKTDLAGRSPADAFESGDVDYAGISAADASWIAYDPDLGPQLRSVLALSTDYYGFDTTRPPFDDVRVRQAFAMAVNWHRIVALVAAGDSTPATSMVPPGIPGRPDANLAPTYDPTQARALLADAGYPGGKGFPRVTLVSSGYGYDEAIVRELHDVLGIQLGYETMPFDQYFNRLSSDAPPAFWSLSWIADFPGPNDFLGVLLAADSSNNYGRWTSDEFEAALARATAADDPAEATKGYEDAERVIAREVPVIPASYTGGWSLSRAGLLGAGQNGLGIVRLAGLAWGDR